MRDGDSKACLLYYICLLKNTENVDSIYFIERKKMMPEN